MAYVHNDNPNGRDAAAEDTRVRFYIPKASSRYIQVQGYITCSNAFPSEYVDYVDFRSDQAFHLEYIEGSAKLENGGIGSEGITLSDNIVNYEHDAVLIGYDALDGVIPGGEDYISLISIRVKAVFDDDFSVKQKVRIVGGEDETFKDAVDANIGDIVEFQFEYRNTSDDVHHDVAVRDILPKSLQYIAGSTRFYTANYPDGAKIDQDNIVSNGLNIGNYATGANAFIRFRAEVVGDTMAYGTNELVSWAQVQAGTEQHIIQDHAKVYVVKKPSFFNSLEVILLILIAICLFLIVLYTRRLYRLTHPKQ